jgi:hypothetical protein
MYLYFVLAHFLFLVLILCSCFGSFELCFEFKLRPISFWYLFSWFLHPSTFRLGALLSKKYANITCKKWLQRWANPSFDDINMNITPWFSWTHQFSKNRKKNLNKYFHFYLMNTFIRFHRFWDFNNIKMLCVLMFLIIAFRKSCKNTMLISFLEFFCYEHKFETWFENFLGNYVSKVILKSFYF